MKSVIFEVAGEQFNGAETYILGAIEELKGAVAYSVWVVSQDTAGGSTPILKGWQVTGDKKLMLMLDESQLQATDKVVICILYQERQSATTMLTGNKIQGE